ncbi:TetR/AcrR family transcriptional regulator [Leptospira sp. 201903074]|uniref:TetR/AcrR family transcriptional regulator n=1 Tax=Leptospira abararensis TaxID=2810036 RepID=UPI0019658425|nr:TetR/AcrR family transcriptional regulator [Leptospira abararensis]MBM9545401.1 TetR/AcrR family transcriptional regulator [Leptospira abararensis]
MAKAVTEKSDLVPKLLGLFCGHGIDGVSIAMVSEVTGLGKGSIYYFFPSGKPDMVEFVIMNAEQFLKDKIVLLTENKMKGKRGIEEFLNSFVNDKDFLPYIHFMSSLALCSQGSKFPEKLNLFYKDLAMILAKVISREGYSNSKAWNIAENVIVSIYGSYLFSCSLKDKDYFVNRIKKINKILMENLKSI